jgi:hypothetical protein
MACHQGNDSTRIPQCRLKHRVGRIPTRTGFLYARQMLIAAVDYLRD